MHKLNRAIFIESYYLAQFRDFNGRIKRARFRPENVWSEGKSIIFEWRVYEMQVAFLIEIEGYKAKLRHTSELSSWLWFAGFKSLGIIHNQYMYNIASIDFLKILIFPVMINFIKSTKNWKMNSIKNY